MTELVLQVPRVLLGLRDSTIRDATARPIAAGPQLTVLRHFLSGVVAADGPFGDGQEEISNTAVELLSATLRPLFGTVEVVLSEEALWQAVRVDMQRHRADPGLTVEVLARRHRVSRRHLEGVFARRGATPAAFLRQLRLDRARHLLDSTPATVTAIAFECGFSDVNTFIRAFRRAHGRTPEDWRRSERAGGSPEDGPGSATSSSLDHVEQLCRD